MLGVVLLGPRQVGKTTLARNIASRKAKSSAVYLLSALKCGCIG